MFMSLNLEWEQTIEKFEISSNNVNQIVSASVQT